MLVKQVLNNSVISAIASDGQEIIYMGRGIGWGAKAGQEVDMSKVEKTFRMDSDESTERLKQLLIEVEPEVMAVSSEIVDYAVKVLGKKLNRNIYITLTDHISFALERMEQNMSFHNYLAYDLRKFYRVEYKIGIKGLELIGEKLGVKLPEDEAASIALHVINSEYEHEMGKTMDITRIIHKSIDMVRYTFMINFDEDSLNYQRFVTHLQFFAQRVLERRMLNDVEIILYKDVFEKYPKQLKVAKAIRQLMEKEYNVAIPDDEVTFLCIHIIRITKN